MKFESTEVWGFEHAIRGMRNPKQSHNRSDSANCYNLECENCSRSKLDCSNIKGCDYIVGENDLKLMQTLIKAGSEHRKFMRQIFVSVDITAPQYFFAELDTYKVGTVANSTSKMHKLASTPITIDCFEMDDFDNFKFSDEYDMKDIWLGIVGDMEDLRQLYLKTKDKRYWKALIRLLPESWLQTRTVTMNYENLLAMYNQRCACPHKLNEWSGKDNPDVCNFKSWVESLPYAKELICMKKEK